MAIKLIAIALARSGDFQPVLEVTQTLAADGMKNFSRWMQQSAKTRNCINSRSPQPLKEIEGWLTIRVNGYLFLAQELLGVVEGIDVQPA